MILFLKLFPHIPVVFTNLALILCTVGEITEVMDFNLMKALLYSRNT